MHTKNHFTKLTWFLFRMFKLFILTLSMDINISISGAVMTLMTLILFLYALLSRNSSFRESKIRIIEICPIKSLRKYRASKFFAFLQRITCSSSISSRVKIKRSLSTNISIIAASAAPSQIHALYFANSILRFS